MNLFRQGDVLIMKVDEVPEDARRVPREDGRIVLAHGEATGHAHAVLERDAKLFEVDDTDERFLEIVQHADVVHEEHDPVRLEPGSYKVVRQREYSPAEIRYVAD